MNLRYMNIIKNDQLRSFLTIFILSLVFFIYQFSIFREIKFQIPTVVFGGPLVVCFALFFTGLGPLLSKLFIKDKESRFHYILLFLPIIFLLSYLSMIYISQMLGPYYNPENFYKIVSQEISTYSPPFTQYLASLLAALFSFLFFKASFLIIFSKKGKKMTVLRSII